MFDITIIIIIIILQYFAIMIYLVKARIHYLKKKLYLILETKSLIFLRIHLFNRGQSIHKKKIIYIYYYL